MRICHFRKVVIVYVFLSASLTAKLKFLDSLLTQRRDVTEHVLIYYPNVMSVVVQSSPGWVLDSSSLVDRGYQRCIRWADRAHVKCSFKRRCFQVIKSHFNLSDGAAVEEHAHLLQNKPSKVKPAAEDALMCQQKYFKKSYF